MMRVQFSHWSMVVTVKMVNFQVSFCKLETTSGETMSEISLQVCKYTMSRRQEDVSFNATVEM